ncbi:hypothetical protein K490DRAFT_65581 [Saccharata proteae CBS 121410]|uniref:Uncharacterized protein n=1 Tax=Saccharata proteae CBS 121410 TaxID=1314787 RepID=A0A9P4HVT7_9PEZI|nr:hypothetical protein K490DRAFT_65581 [Saccharata proteae CBS 121410]
MSTPSGSRQTTKSQGKRPAWTNEHIEDAVANTSENPSTLDPLSDFDSSRDEVSRKANPATSNPAPTGTTSGGAQPFSPWQYPVNMAPLTHREPPAWATSSRHSMRPTRTHARLEPEPRLVTRSFDMGATQRIEAKVNTLETNFGNLSNDMQQLQTGLNDQDDRHRRNLRSMSIAGPSSAPEPESFVEHNAIMVMLRNQYRQLQALSERMQALGEQVRALRRQLRELEEDAIIF